MPEKENKILTGFRLTKHNIDYIDKLSAKLGLNRTNVVDMIITLVRKEQNLLPELIKKQLEDNTV